MMLSRLRVHLPAWRRALRRRRRLLLVLLVTALAATLLPAMLPPSARGLEVVAVRDALAPGTVLAPEHLTTVRLAPELVPAGTALETEQVLGRTTRLPLEAGTPLLPGTLEPPEGAVVPEGSVLMVVPVPRALVAHLGPGTEIELLPADPAMGGGAPVPARVLEVVPEGAGAPVLGASGTGTVEALVTLEQERARELAHALGNGPVLVTVIG